MNTTDKNNPTNEKEYNTSSIASTLIRIASQGILNSTYAVMSLEARCEELIETKIHQGVASYLLSGVKNCGDVVSYVDQHNAIEGVIRNLVKASIDQGEFVPSIFRMSIYNASAAEIDNKNSFIAKAKELDTPSSSESLFDAYQLLQNFVCVDELYSSVCGNASATIESIKQAEEIMGQLSAQNHNHTL
jgi:hypothetical protein